MIKKKGETEQKIKKRGGRAKKEKKVPRTASDFAWQQKLWMMLCTLKTGGDNYWKVKKKKV